MTRTLLAILCCLILLPFRLVAAVLHEFSKYVADVTLRFKLRTDEFLWWVEGKL